MTNEIEGLRCVVEDLTAEVEALREDYAALLRLHNTTAQAARSEECAMRLERRTADVVPSHWINVEKRLPYVAHPVLCFSKSLDGKSYYYSVDYMLDDSQWWNAGLTWKYEVTHWMELPEPPKEADENG